VYFAVNGLFWLISTDWFPPVKQVNEKDLKIVFDGKDAKIIP